VNNEIYPWSTFAYLPILILLGAAAEFGDYRAAILFGTAGRLGTRMLLLYGDSILSQQMGQICYALGSVAEDLFVAYIYYVLPKEVRSITVIYCILQQSASLSNCVAIMWLLFAIALLSCGYC
jgi:hypothetical protein